MWWVVLVGLFAYVEAYYHDIFDTQAALDDFAAVSNVPSIKALTGLAAAPNTLGGAVWTKIWMTCALSLALGVVFLVTRNGRADEELGRTELLRSADARPARRLGRVLVGERGPVRRGRRRASRWCRPPAGSTRPAPGSPAR